MKKLLALLLLPLSTGAMAAFADWTVDQKPFKLYGNSYYVGSKGLSAVLITSPAGHILIDGTVRENAPMIARHVRQLGFKMEDIKLILNSHSHSDHAGGIAELQRMSGAQVLGGAAGLSTLVEGKAQSDDPQFGIRQIRDCGNCIVKDVADNLPQLVLNSFDPVEIGRNI